MALVGAGSDLVADRRIGLAQIVGQPQEVRNFSTTFCSWDDGALTSLIAERTSSIEHPTSNEAKPLKATRRALASAKPGQSGGCKS
jgi:hypothetical protein